MPPFDQVKVEHFEPALEAGMADQLAKIARITAETAPTTFENTIAALERPDRLLKQGRERLRLATLYTKFSQNEPADETNYVLSLEKETELAGLPDAFRSSAAVAAEERGRKGQWAILNTRSSMEPFLTCSDRRELREKVWRTYYSRGDNGDAKDNKAIITEILALRAERARLLGFETYAHWSLGDTMAKTPEPAMQLMEAVWTPAVARVKEEVAEMQAIADRTGSGIRIEPWDYRYYAEKVRKGMYDLEESEVKPYLQLDKLREGMFWVAGEIFGLCFAPVEGVPVYHPDVVVYEVKDAAGRHVGLWYFDPWARPGKRSGAWMNAYRDQERFDGEVPTIVSNNANFVRGAAREPVLVTWDDATTMSHEFGHALHGLLSNVAYPSLSRTNVPPTTSSSPRRSSSAGSRHRRCSPGSLVTTAPASRSPATSWRRSSGRRPSGKASTPSSTWRARSWT